MEAVPPREEKQAAFGIFIPSSGLERTLFTGLFLFFFFKILFWIFLFVYFLAMPHSFWDFSSPNGN